MEFKTKLLERCQAAQAAGSHIGLRELIAWAADLLKEIGGSIDREAVIPVVLEAYDSFVAPFDLPYIPNLIEPRVDAAIRKALETAMDRLFDQAS